MTRKLFSVAALLSLVVFVASAGAQKNEVSGLIGRTFISDHASVDTLTPGALLTSKAGLSFEGNYGRHLKDYGLFGLTAEIPFVVNVGETVHYNLNLVPKDYKSIFVTPGLRANLFPGGGLSPWVSVGGGFGYFHENSELEFGGPNPGQTGTTTFTFQGGFGLDVKLFSRFSVRGEVRDFYSSIPQLNVDIGKSHQHNFFVGAGVVYNF